MADMAALPGLLFWHRPCRAAAGGELAADGAGHQQMSSLPDHAVDCAIIGGGPAGLVAAVYLARFRRSVCVLDAGGSRAALIPTSHNLPGFPDGISGPDFLARLRQQAARYGAPLVPAIVDRLQPAEEGYCVNIGRRSLRAQFLILATGAADIEPELPDLPNAVKRGFLRHCPVCDGYEVMGQHVGVIGRGRKLAEEALFIRDYTDRLSVFSLPPGLQLAASEQAELARRGVQVHQAPVAATVIEGERVVALHLADGSTQAVDTLYSALGSVVRSELAIPLGVEMLRTGELQVDRRNMSTGVPGLYAIGDVVKGLSQISVAAGHAALAATAIHHQLRKRTGAARRTAR